MQTQENLRNFYKNTIDLEFTGIDSDKAIAVMLEHDGKLDEKVDVSFQYAMLYTTCTGQRNGSNTCSCSAGYNTVRECFKYGKLDITVNLLMKKGIYF